MVSRLLQAWFGYFEREELKKYIFLGVIYLLILCTYWTIIPLKDSIFGHMIVGYGKTEGRDIYLALAKTVSLLVLIPVIIGYGRLADKIKKHHLFFVIVTMYALIMFGWALFFAHHSWGLVNRVADPLRISGWFWFAFTESFSAIVIAAFWAFVTDTSTALSARRGFGLIVMIGHIGGIIGPWYLSKIPRLFQTTNAVVVGICALLLLLAGVLFRIFLTVTPKSQLTGYQKQKVKVESKKRTHALMEGFRLLITHKYLLGILVMVAFFQIITTIIDFNFNTMIYTHFQNSELASEYLSQNAFWINVFTFGFLFFGINNIQRWLGLAVSLSLVPITLAVAILMFKIYPQLDVLFYCMIGAKVINFSLNLPSTKQLYVPTTEGVRYKSQAWIDSLGPNGGKAFASGINSTKCVLGFPLYLALVMYLSLGIAALWVFIALSLARTRNKAVERKELVC